MKVEAMKSFFETPDKWQNFESMILGNGNRVYATGVKGFKRKRKLIEPEKIPGYNPYAIDIRPDNWYFTFDPDDKPNIGTLELDEELGVLRYTEVMEGRIVEYDIESIMAIMYKSTDTPNYPGVAAIV